MAVASEVRDLDPGDAVLAVKVSGLHIGVTWPLLGGRDDFDPRAWPVPELESEVQLPNGDAVRSRDGGGNFVTRWRRRGVAR